MHEYMRIYHTFQDISVFSKVLVEWKQIVFANTCLLVNNPKMNSVDTLNEYYCYENKFWWIMMRWLVLPRSFGGTNFIR